MYKSEDIKTVHLEITSKCNATCPMCSRNQAGGEANPYLPIHEITLVDFKKIFPAEFLQQLEKFYMCGNNGEPVVARDTLEIFEYIRSLNPKIHLSMNTNGSARTTEWWARLAKILSVCRFSIDGLADTNSIYRKNTEWPKIINNAQAYIEAGGHAVWDFIVFKHNEHQVEMARDLAKRMGFKKFQTKKTGRFYSNTSAKVKNAQAVYNKQGTVVYQIEPPLNPEYRNNALELERHLIDKYKSLDNYFDQTIIDCKVAKEKSVYVDAGGLVFPCCWTAGQLYIYYLPEKHGQVWDLIRAQQGVDKINAKLQDIRSIIDSEWIQNKFSESWQKPGIKCGKLKVCAKNCGQEFDTFREQYR